MKKVREKHNQSDRSDVREAAQHQCSPSVQSLQCAQTLSMEDQNGRALLQLAGIERVPPKGNQELKRTRLSLAGEILELPKVQSESQFDAQESHSDQPVRTLFREGLQWELHMAQQLRCGADRVRSCFH